MNALLLIASVLFADQDPGTYLRELDRSEQLQAATTKEAKKLTDLIAAYQRARVDPRAEAGIANLLPNGSFAFHNATAKEVQIAEVKNRLVPEIERLNAAKKNKFYANDWYYQDALKNVGQIGRYSDRTRIIELVDENSIKLGFTNHGELGGSGVTVILKGVDTSKLLKGQYFVCPPMMVCTEILNPKGNWKWYAVEPITAEQIKDRAAAERKARDAGK
jgi:hypothetical protein